MRIHAVSLAGDWVAVPDLAVGSEQEGEKRKA
jgi:hypothetical protein